MSVYVSLRDNIYDALNYIFPTTEIVQMHTNGPEPVSPYIAYDIKSVDQKGREYISTFANSVSTQQIVVQYEPKITFEFIGKQDGESAFAAAELADGFNLKLNYTGVREAFLKSGLSYLRKGSLRMVPKKRETDWYMCYQIDVFFGYQVEARQDVDIIESVEIEGEYTHNDYDSFTTTIQIP